MRILLTLLILVPFFAQSQKEEKKEVRKVIDLLFDGMRKGDSTQVRAVFLPGATLNTSSVNSKGQSRLHRDTISGFLNAIGTPHKETWDERILSCEIRIDENLATVWTKYAFYVDNVYSHEGVNAFQLVKLEGQWKILTITDTRRKSKGK